MIAHQVTENIIFMLFNVLLSTLVVACLKHLDEGGVFQAVSASTQPDVQTTLVQTIAGFPAQRWQPCLTGDKI